MSKKDSRLKAQVVEALERKNAGPIFGQCDAEKAHKAPLSCAGSSTAWATSYLYAVEKMGGRGVAMGSDVNGAAALPGPRFGTYAAYGANGDRHRQQLRRAQIDAQQNGVRYATPIRDYRWHRFDEGGSNAYDREEREAWQGIAQYAAGFQPDRDQHPDDDVPPIALTTIDNRLHYTFRQDNIDNITRGFWLADEAEANQMPAPKTRSDLKARWPDEQFAGRL